MFLPDDGVIRPRSLQQEFRELICVLITPSRVFCVDFEAWLVEAGFVDFRRLNVRSKFTSVTFEFVSAVIFPLHRHLKSLTLQSLSLDILTYLNCDSVVFHSAIIVKCISMQLGVGRGIVRCC